MGGLMRQRPVSPAWFLEGKPFCEVCHLIHSYVRRTLIHTDNLTERQWMISRWWVMRDKMNEVENQRAREWKNERNG